MAIQEPGQYPATAAAPITHTQCLSAFSWNEQTPLGHFQDLDWIEFYNGTFCGAKFLAYNHTTRAWQYQTAKTCVNSAGTTFSNYVVGVCNQNAAFQF